MGFWGIEVKPGKSHPYHSDNVQGKLHVTQATLGLGSSNEKSILQCSVGHKNPIFLCSLLPNKIESCPLDLEFDEDDLVAFSVIGKQSIHLSGYFVSDNGDYLRDEYDTDSYGEDIADTESDESSEFDTEDEYGDDFIDDDNDELFPPSPVRNSGVVIEEIMDEDKPTLGNVQSKKLKKKDQASDSEKRIIVKNGANVPIVESEDEDGFPVSKKSVGNSQQTQMKVDEVPDKKTSEEVEKSKQSTDQEISRKRKDKNTDQDDQQERKKKKKKKQKEKAEEGKLNEAGAPNETNDFLEEANQQELKGDDVVQKECKSDANEVPSESQPEKKKKKQKKKKQAQENEGDKPTDQTVSTAGDKMETTSSAEKMQSATKSTKTRTFPNGLVIEELAMGKPDAKRASPGKQVSVQYIGKLQKNGKIFDSNVGRAPFKFRLGVGEVIKGWDVGVNGMRVGDKRRLTIPPAMGYGTKGAGGKIPPNAWLMFDVELKGVR